MSPPSWPGEELSPATASMSPPSPEVPRPTIKVIIPPDPTFEFPDNILTAPLLPELALPVSKNKPPETPCLPASAVFNIISPEDVDDDCPVKMDTIPPVDLSEVLPAKNITSPPDPELLSPTATTTSPPPPFTATPLFSKILPESPRLAVPVCIIIEPLTPSDPEFAVDRRIFPEEEARP